MHCPACHIENAVDAVSCVSCGRSLSSAPIEPSAPTKSKAVRRSGSRRRRSADDGETEDNNVNRPAHRAYRLSLWSIVPGLGLLLGPVAAVAGVLALRGASSDRNRAWASILLGILVALTQWIGVALMVRGWASM